VRWWVGGSLRGLESETFLKCKPYVWRPSENKLHFMHIWSKYDPENSSFWHRLTGVGLCKRGLLHGLTKRFYPKQWRGKHLYCLLSYQCCCPRGKSLSSRTNLQVLVLVLGPQSPRKVSRLRILQTVRYVWSRDVHKFCYRHRAWGYGEDKSYLLMSDITYWLCQ